MALTTHAANAFTGPIGPVKVSSSEVTIARAFAEIERQTGYIFGVNNSRLDVSLKVNMPESAMPLEEALNIILAGTGHTYSIVRNHILITPGELKPTPQKNEVPASRAPRSSRPPGHISQAARRQRAENPGQAASSVPQNSRQNTVQIAVELTQQVAAAPKSAGEYRFKGSDADFRTPGNYAGKEGIAESFMPAAGKSRPHFALKTNLLYWATLTPNLGVEIGTGIRTTVNLFGSYNPWNLRGTEENNAKLVHWVVQPEFRYWFCERFNGHNVGATFLYSQFNVGGKELNPVFDRRYRYEGCAYGGGVSYGYHWMLAPHVGLEFSLGVGVIAMNYKQYDCAKCGDLMGEKSKLYFGPTKAGVTLVFLIK